MSADTSDSFTAALMAGKALLIGSRASGGSAGSPADGAFFFVFMDICALVG